MHILCSYFKNVLEILTKFQNKQKIQRNLVIILYYKLATYVQIINKLETYKT